MQYLLVDAHQRFLGTFISTESLSVGDTFKNHNDQAYTVVGLNWSRQTTPKAPSLTVIPLQGNFRKAMQN
jgi:hypothetical protein